MEEAKVQSAGSRRTRRRANDDIPVQIFAHTRLDYEEELEFRLKAPKQTGLVYDERMLLHKHEWDENYPECPARISKPWERINILGLVQRCLRIPVTPVEETSTLLLGMHRESYMQYVRNACAAGDRPSVEALMKTYHGICLNEHTWEASKLAAGGVLELTRAVVEEKVLNGMAIVRPPGHHAMQTEACGYCFINNVGLAAQWATQVAGVKRVLIVDWDVHHGQGTQYEFYDRKDVLYFSIHRYQHALFWPNLRESDYDFVGVGQGAGYNVNVPLNKTGMTNSDYLAIFNNLLMPIAYEYCPQLVIVSSGYDAAIGCPEGSMELTPACYAHFIYQLMALARGKVVVALEGGYFIESLSEGVALTLRSLLGDAPPRLVEDLEEPSDSIVESIGNCVSHLRGYWKSLRTAPVSQVVLRPDLSGLKTDSWSDVKEVEWPEEYPILEPEVKMVLQRRLRELIIYTELQTPLEGRTCYVFDEQMMKHANPATRICHPEVPERIQFINAALEACGLLDMVTKLPSRVATHQEMSLVHSDEYLKSLQDIEGKPRRLHLIMTQTATNSCYYSPHVLSASALACGSLLNVVDAVCEGKFLNGFAAIRPPGHHAGSRSAEGFCYVNHVAVAARYAQQRWGVRRVLIVDWDVHHGNGTQEIFEEDPSVLFVSLHRHDPRKFYPFTHDGSPTAVGKERGVGFNVNVAFRHHHTRDSAYVMAFLHVLLPLAMEFNPDLVLVSSGFDAADGDSLGGFKISPPAFAHMTHHLGRLAGGKLILALEGGYKDRCLASCSCQCVSSLLGLPCPRLPDAMRPKQRDIEAIRKTVSEHAQYWKSLRFTEPGPEMVSVEDGRNRSVSSANSIVDEFSSMRLTALGQEDGLNPIGADLSVVDCPHLDLRQPLPAAGHQTDAPCLECGKTGENWVCLTCFEVHCSRFVEGHMLNHTLTTEHPLVLSYADFSVWCYDCNHYIHNPELDSIVQAAVQHKFPDSAQV